MAPAIDRRRVLAAMLLLRRLRRRRQSMWVHPLNQRRPEFGSYHHLVAELQLYPDRHRDYFRMSAEKMEELLSKVGPEIQHQDTNYRLSIEPKQRLAVTIRFLATGESFRSLAFQYRLGKATVANIVHTTVRAIKRCMLSTQFPPMTEGTWKATAEVFWERWGFPNCLGAIDGKHINISAPANSGSQYFNYKGHFSVVLLALADANYRLLFFQVGDYGRTSDGGVFSASRLKKGLQRKTLHVPGDVPLPGSGVHGPMPYVVLGDAAFPLKTFLMRPFPGRSLPPQKETFNYRL